MPQNFHEMMTCEVCCSCGWRHLTIQLIFQRFEILVTDSITRFTEENLYFCHLPDLK